MIPIKKEKMGQFVLSLLGQPQSIERETLGIFNVNLEWLINLHNIINQRIVSQNESTLANFSVEISFYNDSKRILHTVEELERYNEVKRVTTKEVKLTWTYIVKFPSSELPERQSISIFISTEGLRINENKSSLTKLLSAYKGIVRYQIASTERTWADDIDKIFDSEIDKILKKDSILHLIGNLVVVIGIYLSMIGSVAITFIYRGIYINEKKEGIIKSIVENSTNEATNKIDFLYKLAVADIDKVGLNPIPLLLSILGGFGALFIGTILLTIKEPCFLTLTQKDEIFRERKNKKQGIKLALWILGFIVSLFGGLLSNHIYYLLTH